MIPLPLWLLQQFTETANKDLCFKGFDQEVIVFPTKVVGDWIILQRNRIHHSTWHSHVSLYRIKDYTLQWVGSGSRQLERALLERCDSASFQCLKLTGDLHKSGIVAAGLGIDVYVALVPVRAYPSKKS